MAWENLYEDILGEFEAAAIPERRIEHLLHHRASMEEHRRESYRRHNWKRAKNPRYVAQQREAQTRYYKSLLENPEKRERYLARARRRTAHRRTRPEVREAERLAKRAKYAALKDDPEFRTHRATARKREWAATKADQKRLRRHQENTRQWARDHYQRKPPREPKKCAQCGVEFVPSRLGPPATYCSKKCKRAAWRESVRQDPEKLEQMRRWRRESHERKRKQGGE